ncbi:MAG: peptidylprolyl isomerase [Actinomycetia bacterium]|nr:peptidylprolyl isomerase [Actinomycetes bacterium]
MGDDKRREAARCRLQAKLTQREQREASKRRRTLIASIAGMVVVIIGLAVGLTLALGGAKHPSASATTAPATAPGVPAPTGSPIEQTNGACHYVKAVANAAAAKNAGLTDVGLPPDPNPTPTKDLKVTFNTNRGVIEATLNGANAPCNVQSLAYLIAKKFYDNTACPRVVNSGIFVVQCGSGNNTTAGGPNYKVADEGLATAKYDAGTIAMANSGPNSNGSQFFFVTADSNDGLQPNYTVVGHVTKGLDILAQVADAGSSDASSPTDGTPKLTLRFKTVRIASVVGGGPTPGIGPTPTIMVTVP